MNANGSTAAENPQKRVLDTQLERTGWAAFLVMIGCLALLPAGWVPAGTWLLGTGLIMIGLSGVRHFKNLSVSGFTMVLGLIALALGVSAVAGVDLPLLAILLVAVGLQIVYSVLTHGREASK